MKRVRTTLIGIALALVSWCGSLQAQDRLWNPEGFLQSQAWGYLFPLTNPYGCNGGGDATMRRNWVAPHDLGVEAPKIGEVWEDIDFARTAAAGGFEGSAFFERFGLGPHPRWVTIDDLNGAGERLLGEFFEPAPNFTDVIGYQAILDHINNRWLPTVGGVPRISTDNVFGVRAQLHPQRLRRGQVLRHLRSERTIPFRSWSTTRSS